MQKSCVDVLIKTCIIQKIVIFVICMCPASLSNAVTSVIWNRDRSVIQRRGGSTLPAGSPDTRGRHQLPAMSCIWRYQCGNKAQSSCLRYWCSCHRYWRRHFRSHHWSSLFDAARFDIYFCSDQTLLMTLGFSCATGYTYQAIGKYNTW